MDDNELKLSITIDGTDEVNKRLDSITASVANAASSMNDSFGTLGDEWNKMGASAEDTADTLLDTESGWARLAEATLAYADALRATREAQEAATADRSAENIQRLADALENASDAKQRLNETQLQAQDFDKTTPFTPSALAPAFGAMADQAQTPVAAAPDSTAGIDSLNSLEDGWHRVAAASLAYTDALREAREAEQAAVANRTRENLDRMAESLEKVADAKQRLNDTRLDAADFDKTAAFQPSALRPEAPTGPNAAGLETGSEWLQKTTGETNESTEALSRNHSAWVALAEATMENVEALKEVSAAREAAANDRSEASVKRLADALQKQAHAANEVKEKQIAAGEVSNSFFNILGKGSGVLGELAGTIGSKLGIPMAEVRAKFQELTEAAGGMGIELLTVGSFAATLGATVFEMGESFAQSSREIMVQSEFLGISTETYQMVGLAADRAGVSAEGARYGFMMLARELAQASDQGGQTADKMERLGILGLNSSQAVEKLAQSLGNEATAGEATARIRETLGMRGARLLPILRQLADESKATGKSIHELAEDEKYAGLLFDETDLKAGKQAMGPMVDLEENWTALYNTMKKGALPVFEDMVPVLMGLTDVFIGAVAGVHGLAVVGEALVQTIVELGHGFVNLITGDGGAFKEWIGALKLDLEDLVKWFHIGLEPPEMPTEKVKELAEAVAHLNTVKAQRAAAPGDKKLLEEELEATERVAKARKEVAAEKPEAVAQTPDYAKETRELQHALHERLVAVGENRAAQASVNAAADAQELAQQTKHRADLMAEIKAPPAAGVDVKALQNELDNVNKQIIATRSKLEGAQAAAAKPGQELAAERLATLKAANAELFREREAEFKNEFRLGQISEEAELTGLKAIEQAKIDAETSYLQRMETLEKQKATLHHEPTKKITEKYEGYEGVPGEIADKQAEGKVRLDALDAQLAEKQRARAFEAAREQVAAAKQAVDSEISLEEFKDKQLRALDAESAVIYKRQLLEMADAKKDSILAELEAEKQATLKEGGADVANKVQKVQDKIVAATAKGELDRLKAVQEGNQGIEAEAKKDLDLQLTAEEDAAKFKLSTTQKSLEEEYSLHSITAYQLHDLTLKAVGEELAVEQDAVDKRIALDRQEFEAKKKLVMESIALRQSQTRAEMAGATPERKLNLDKILTALTQEAEITRKTTFEEGDDYKQLNEKKQELLRRWLAAVQEANAKEVGQTKTTDQKLEQDFTQVLENLMHSQNRFVSEGANLWKKWVEAGGISIRQIQTEMNTSLTQMIMRQETFAQAVKKLWTDIATSAVSQIIKMAEKWVMEHVVMTLIGKLFHTTDSVSSKTADTQKVASATATNTTIMTQLTASEATKAIMYTADAAAFSAAELQKVGAAGIGAAALKGIIEAQVATEAGLAAAAEFADVMEVVPFPANLATAPAMAALAFSQAMAFGSAAQGALIDKEMMMQVHPKEMILPEHISTPLQAALAPTSGPSSAPARPGHSSAGMHLHYSPQISAMDTGGAKEIMDEHLKKNLLPMMRKIQRTVSLGGM